VDGGLVLWVNFLDFPAKRIHLVCLFFIVGSLFCYNWSGWHVSVANSFGVSVPLLSIAQTSLDFDIDARVCK
jgi:hypothetical protein